MKKIEYQAPEIEIIKIAASKVICASDPNVTDPDDFEYD
jgi:hypothetical protein